MNGQGPTRYQEPPPRLLALCNLILSVRTQSEIEAANDAARRHLQRYPEDRMIVMEASKRMATVEDALRQHSTNLD
jgi:outer membrane protein assembly factor BamD (BamD/ComL family)